MVSVGQVVQATPAAAPPAYAPQGGSAPPPGYQAQAPPGLLARSELSFHQAQQLAAVHPQAAAAQQQASLAVREGGGGGAAEPGVT